MFSHLDATFKLLGMDQGVLLKMLALERAGPRHFGEMPVRIGSCQEASSAFLILRHRKQHAANDQQHVLLQKDLFLGVLILLSLEPTIRQDVNIGG